MKRGKAVSVYISLGTCHLLRKQDVCLYDLDANRTPSTFLPVELQDQSTNGVLRACPGPIPPALGVVPSEFKPLGYGDSTKGTPGVLRSVGESASLLYQPPPRDCPAPSEYVSMIRELPSQRHIDILVHDFFRNVAWHYDIVDEAAFMNQLAQWRRLTHDQFKRGPDALPTTLRSFPALLFQVLAQTLLFQPAQHIETLNDLKYAVDMELSDRAAEYSDAGRRLASSFRKSEPTLTGVQAELMRACFEKSTGAVIEAWHTLGTAIRDAQELGLHLTEPDSTTYSRSAKSSDREMGRNVWLILHLWDAHMGIVLGRPMSTRISPNDVASPMSSRDSSGNQRPPQPRDVILCGYHTAYKFLQEIHDLEKLEDWRIPVDKIHETILTNIANLPGWATVQRSRQGEPPWLSAALETMYTNVQFVVFALHRPFIFAEPNSRHKAFDAAMQILESQGRLFDQTEPLQYKAFSLVFATFDAMVLVAAVHIRFPDELREQFTATRRILELGIERLKSLQARKNVLANSALSIVERLYQKMLATVYPEETLDNGQGGNDDGSFTIMETETVGANWGTILQPDLGDVLVPQPMNELLRSGYLAQSLSTSPSLPAAYGQDQFGMSIMGSFGYDSMPYNITDDTLHGAK
ncbi:uncharacterized protein FFUJ_05431 [Fusarium fujikuroi IMI 58289]|uniref:Xylanolytic transcriptional activator regulatory domain-containing protein n=1 Tax=Gibberella fujikuroi (strain CBS 195.34 / IMI 58289 / NRRL A-6831) TaxID=1279085 RepID=S0EAR7_GIBF5|nr:uncharacterized protein FFUJ_05431 [Fusarium fujikuroi IMI 58289]CCT69538.1 uncharacterized protein FFUJ_05431 [Fusarium fujikuroi IMI 58289]SCO26564.1 uncharacterized protein FFM5_14833 [Fusarium fujikuroi]